MSELAQLVAGDDFSMASLTEAVNALPSVRTRLGEMKLFKEGGITTTTAAIERKDGQVSILSAKPRTGGDVPEMGESDRKLITIPVPHYPIISTIQADELTNIRELGKATSTKKAVMGLIVEKQAEQKASFDATWEYARFNALFGKIVDIEGGELYNLFTLFGITAPGNFNFDLSGTAEQGLIKVACNELARSIARQLVTPPTEIHAFVGNDFYDALVKHPECKEAYARWNNGESLRDGYRKPFKFGDVVFENYIGGVGNTQFLNDAQGRAFPQGVPGLFQTKFAPANYMGATNTKGKPLYTQKQALDWDQGVQVKTQSNPIMYCRQPEVCRTLTYST